MRLSISCIIFLLVPLKGVDSYASGSVATAELTVLGSELTDDIREEYKVDEKVESQFGPNATFFLSKRTEYDLNDLTQSNVTFCGMDVSEDVASEVANGTSTTKIEHCEAYFGDVNCDTCRPCTVNINVNWTVLNSAIQFDCSGIEENRQCSGVFNRPLDAEEGDVCFVEEGAWNGKETCFVDAPTTPSPTSPPTTPSPTSTSSGVSLMGVVLSIVMSSVAISLIV